MRRTSLYSRSPRSRPEQPAGVAPPPQPPAPRSWRAQLQTLVQRHDRALMLVCGFLAACAAFGLFALSTTPVQPLTQQDIDAAVLHSLEQRPPEPSRAAVAYEVIRPSVVLVRRLGEDEAPGARRRAQEDKGQARRPEAQEFRGEKPDEPAITPDEKSGRQYSLRGLATGVVFSADGKIFTNLHVVAGAEKVGVVFADGTESEVDLLGVQPEHDLAVLKARTLPDDLRPATLRSTQGLRIGDEVLAVGFPFGIGPTATYGVVSGLRREHYSKEGRRNLIDLIQFDAAANPGNSGGPLVTREGDVVGIVTSILNPTEEGFFVGIAFAVPIENAAAAAGVSPF